MEKKVLSECLALGVPPWRHLKSWDCPYVQFDKTINDKDNLALIAGLVVWNMNFMTFHILGIIVPTDYYFSEG